MSFQHTADHAKTRTDDRIRAKPVDPAAAVSHAAPRAAGTAHVSAANKAQQLQHTRPPVAAKRTYADVAAGREPTPSDDSDHLLSKFCEAQASGPEVEGDKVFGLMSKEIADVDAKPRPSAAGRLPRFEPHRLMSPQSQANFAVEVVRAQGRFVDITGEYQMLLLHKWLIPSTSVSILFIGIYEDILDLDNIIDEPPAHPALLVAQRTFL